MGALYHLIIFAAVLRVLAKVLGDYYVSLVLQVERQNVRANRANVRWKKFVDFLR